MITTVTKILNTRVLSSLLLACVIFILLKNYVITPSSSAGASPEKPNQEASTINKLLEALNLMRNSNSPATSVKLCTIPPLANRTQFMDYMDANHFECKNFKYMGKGYGGDGRKGTCFDDIFHITPGKCNVLSFGIHNDWSFDDQFGKYGCQVNSFDPTTGREDQKLAENVTFHNLGISNMTGELRLARKDHCKVDTYKNILDKLGLTNSVIHYLKMDVENGEYPFFEDVLSKHPNLMQNVKQFGLEAHYLNVKNDETYNQRFLWKYFHQLGCLGFRIMEARHYNQRTEMVFVRP